MRRLPSEVQAVLLLLAITGLAAGVVAAATTGPSTSAQHAPKSRATPILGPTPIPAIFPGPLDGLPTAKGKALRRPIAIIMDNFEPDARPQSGLSSASVIFETLVEGGITRLMPIFLERGAGSVGPIRSARPYFIDWAAGYRALFVHDGGSPAALALLPHTPQLGDLDAPANASAFVRTQDRQPPYNLYSTTADIRVASASDGYNHKVSFTWMPHKAPGPLAGRASATSIHVDFSLPSLVSPGAYAVDYRWDPASNQYLRSAGAAPAIDQVTNRQLAAANIVAIETDISPISGDVKNRLRIRTLGKGDALVFQSGQVVRAHWSKASPAGALELRDLHGRQIDFDPGTTWFEVVPPGAVTYRSR